MPKRLPARKRYSTESIDGRQSDHAVSDNGSTAIAQPHVNGAIHRCQAPHKATDEDGDNSGDNSESEEVMHNKTEIDDSVKSEEEIEFNTIEQVLAVLYCD
ncbi:hypothetical protein PTI98_011846 [Pleurotus ostreatus]|nr:hypothetical protein PTI98_011846 [Pleurotus ostreatus]